jgi:hypothetical protein
MFKRKYESKKKEEEEEYTGQLSDRIQVITKNENKPKENTKINEMREQ